MNLSYSNSTDQSVFSLRDFSCSEINKEAEKDASFRILWVKEGTTTVTVDGIPKKIAKNHILFLTPLHKLKITDTSTGVITFSFNKEFYCIKEHDSEVSCYGYLFYGSSDIPILELNEKEHNSFELLFQIMHEEFEEKDKIQGEMLQMLLKRMLIKSTRIAKQGLANPSITKENLDIVRKFNVLVEMHFHTKHKVSEYAELLHKSPKTLANVFAQYDAQSPSQIINNRIVLEAKRLLLYTDKSAKEIAFELGYDDAAVFSRFFKKQTGTSPSNYKKQD